jgi:apolipoprotein N-acyltransferase
VAAAWTACALSGGLLILCFPPLNLWWLAWVALVPWLWVVYTRPRGVAVWGSWLMAAVALGGVMSWLTIFGTLPWILVSLVWTAPILIAGLALHALAGRDRWQRVLGAPLLWVAWEWVQSIAPFGGVPWAQVGHSQAPSAVVIQVASWFGVPGISALIVLANAAVADALADAGCRGWRRWRGVAVVGGGIALILGAAAYRPALVAMQEHERSEMPPPALSVLLVQGGDADSDVAHLNTPWSVALQQAQLGRYESLTVNAPSNGFPLDLVIWPESAIPAYLNADPIARGRVQGFARGMRRDLISGGQRVGPDGSVYNSAFLFTWDGRLTAQYDKGHLVPFGEYVPGRSWLPFLKYYQVRGVDLSPGRKPTLFRVKGEWLGPMICWESVFPEPSRKLTEMGAGALVIITNDAWFGRTAAAEQHARIAVFRAVESGAYVVRAATTGVSCVIDPFGQPVGGEADDVFTPRFGTRTVGPVRVETLPRLTVFRQGGYLFPRYCVGGALLLLALGRRRRR